MTRRRVVVHERALRALWGYCDPDSGNVVLARGIAGRDRLGTLVHELLHVALPATAEEEVERITAVLTRVLWRQGYRRAAEKKSHDC